MIAGIYERETRTASTEHVTAREIPHARNKLSEATAEEGHANNKIAIFNTASADIVDREDHGRRCERKETANETVIRQQTKNISTIDRKLETDRQLGLAATEGGVWRKGYGS